MLELIQVLINSVFVHFVYIYMYILHVHMNVPSTDTESHLIGQ
jgi:hypothetical protein